MEQILKYPDIPKERTQFVKNAVKSSKDIKLKTRLQTLIISKGMSETEFYNSLLLSKQSWYMISWGIWEIKPWLKIKIAKALNVDSRVIWP